MSVMLVPIPIDDAHDLRFGIRERDLRYDWKVSGPDYSSESVRKYIPKTSRAAVLDEISRAIAVLVKFATPVHVTMETYSPSLSEAALQKYDRIQNVLESLNYATKDRFRDETTFKDYWLFQKRGLTE